MEISGLLPLAQIRETMSAVRVLAEILPLERLYGLRPPEWYEIHDFQWSPLSICEALAVKRGYLNHGGVPDTHRSGLEILRDAVDGVICLHYLPSPQP